VQGFPDIVQMQRSWTIRAELPAGSQAPSAARETLAPLLESLEPTVASAVALVASELVTNSVRHSPGGESALIELEASIVDRHIRLTVRDSGHGFDPGAHAPEPGTASGWGLQVVDGLVDRWWVEVDHGTRVTCELTAA
jgi:anti-sigma regulatory factor (Ser/Thr protein kinase)